MLVVLCELVEQLASIHKCPPSRRLGKCGVHRYTMIARDAGIRAGFFRVFCGPAPRARRRLYGAGVPVIAIDDADDPRLVRLRRAVRSASSGAGSRPSGASSSPSRRSSSRRCCDRGGRVRSVLVTPDAARRAGRRRSTALDAPVYVARPEVLRQVVGFDLHRGAVASGERWPLPPVGSRARRRAARRGASRGSSDHENLGGLFRNAAAFGIDAVLLDAETRRSAVPPLRAGVDRPRAHRAVDAARRRSTSCASRGFTLLALTPAADARAARRGRLARAVRAAARVRRPGLVRRVARGRRRAGAHPDAAAASTR